MIVPKHKNANMWCVAAPVLKNLSWRQAIVSHVAVVHRDRAAAMARRVFTQTTSSEPRESGLFAEWLVPRMDSIVDG